MSQTHFGRWTIELDPDSTRRAYSQIKIGAPEACGCSPCLNFASQRSGMFPEAVRQFMDNAGICMSRETEIYHNGVLESGLHSYGGWFHLIGRLVEGTDTSVPIDGNSGTFDLHDFSSECHIGVTAKTQLVHSAFSARELLQLEFAVEIPWVISDVEPTD